MKETKQRKEELFNSYEPRCTAEFAPTPITHELLYETTEFSITIDEWGYPVATCLAEEYG